MSNSSLSRQELQSYRRSVALMLLASALLAFALFLPIRSEVIEIYDEGSYYVAAADIREHGPLTKFTAASLHSYLFPSVLAYGIPSWLGVSKNGGRLAVFVLQTILFLVTALAIAGAIRPAFGSKRALAILAMLCLNPFTLIYLGYSLTDSFSLTLTLASLTAIAVSFQKERALGLKSAFLSGLLFGAAVMARPANIYLLSLALPALLLHLYQGVRLGRGRQAAIACVVAIVSALIVCVPESLNRYRNFGVVSPLIIDSGVGQLVAARTNLKYATYVGPGALPMVYYRNPFYPSAEQAPVTGLSKARAWVLSTLAKVFGLVDQDFIRPYVFSFTTPDRWLGTVLSLGLFLAGVIGLTTQTWAAFKTLWRSRFRTLAQDQAFALCCFLTVGGCTALYSQTVVEGRFGLPILAITALFIPFTLDWWRRLGPAFKGVAIASFLLFIAAGCVLSHWMQSLAESIVRAWAGTL